MFNFQIDADQDQVTCTKKNMGVRAFDSSSMTFEDSMPSIYVAGESKVHTAQHNVLRMVEDPKNMSKYIFEVQYSVFRAIAKRMVRPRRKSNAFLGSPKDESPAL